MKQETIPIFCKSRTVPYALRNLVYKELDTLINNGVLHTVSHSKWATLIVAVSKLDGNGREAVRICDCDKTANSSKPGLEPAFLELKGKHTNQYAGRGYTRWAKWFIRSFPTSILGEWFPIRFARKCFRGQPMESEMATFPQPSLLSGTTLRPLYDLLEKDVINENLRISQKFTIETGSKPLLTLFGRNKSVPTLINARMQRWTIIHSNYDYIIKYKKGTELLLADALSRLPCKNDVPIDEFRHFICFFSDFETLKRDGIQRAASLDPCLSKVFNYTRFGWPTNIDDNLRDLKRVKDELSVEGNCLLRANRLVIPEVWYDKILEHLHNEHPGIFRMKQFARAYFWFPKIDKFIENFVNKCIPCQLTRSSAPKVKSNFWPLSGKPFERVHIDFAELENRNVLIVKDSHSKWIDVSLVNSIDSKSTISHLSRLFACFGLPSEIVSDNAAQFKSELFLNFFKSNGIHTINSPPYHPNSNGAAENSVSVVKNMLQRQALSNLKYDSFQHRLDSALFAYKNTPSSVTLKIPAELLFRYLPQTTITKVRNNHLSKEKRYQDYQKSYFNLSVNNKIRYVHSDHLRKSEVDVVDDSNLSKFRTTVDSKVNIPSVRHSVLPALDTAIKPNEEITQCNSTNETMSNAELSTSNSVSSPISESVTSPLKSTRPNRNIKPPKRYSDES
ncbi:Uncharacterized protein K02A2.6 [Araneus ventricosus]|uniref:RNA-directed DNA polymerase n=1 Tax=Araneus ventricosus TaxID=182803 RepID=A0A4Y2KJS9_ARAVE|nr:Uncharacterized protein K02A2.6 [Araneus ventricosus]